MAKRTEAQKVAQRKYNASAKGKATIAAYEATPARREYMNAKASAYHKTTKGREVNNKAQRDYKLRKPPTPADKARAVARERARHTGVTPELFAALMDLQGGCCAICNVPFIKRIQADHCHDTKKPRGLLCVNCNTVEGKIKKMGLTPHGFADRLQRYLDNPPAQIEGLV